MGEFYNFDYHHLVSIPKKELTIINEIKVPLSAEKKFRTQNKLKKILFFVVREGIIRTYYKWRSFVTFSGNNNHQCFLIAFNSETQKYYAGYQLSIRQPMFYFSPKNVFSVEPEIKKFKNIFHYNPFIGYAPNEIEPTKKNTHPFRPITFRKDISHKPNQKSLYIIGGGRYVLTEILPVFQNYNHKGFCEFNYELLQNRVFDKFELKTNDFDVLLESAQKDNSEKLFIISSYHSYHTDQAVRIMEIENAKVIIEKPPCITFEDYHRLLNIYDTNRIYIAYHRRFAPWNNKVRGVLEKYDSPLLVNMIIHEVSIPEHHWYFAPNQGTRISGNLCHWIDLAYFWIQLKPIKLSIDRNTVLGVDYSIYNILFQNGTLVNFIPSGLGDETNGVQEYITILGKGLTIKLNDYLQLKIWENGKKRSYFKVKRDKGHIRINKFYTKYVKSGVPSPYSKKDFVLATYTYIKFVEMWRNKKDIFEFPENFSTNYPFTP